MPEGGYAASAQFKSISDTATSAAMSVATMATHFAAISASMYTMSSAVQSFAQLQQTLVLANSVAQGSAEQLNQMTNAVRDFALAYKFSASEGASALYFLASAGYTVGQSLSAMNAVMLYSQGTLSDVAHSAETLATSMSAFGLAATDANRVANLFMASIAATQATPEKLAYAMRQVAPIASAMGASIEETVGALSELFNVGNRGQQAGTILRDVLLRISAPTTAAKEAFNAMGIAIQTTTGESRNFLNVLSDLAKIGPSIQTLDTIFGTRGTTGAKVLLDSLSAKTFQAKTTPTSKDYDSGYSDRVAAANKAIGNSMKEIDDPVKLIKTDMGLMNYTLNNTQMATRIANQQLVTLAGSFSLARNAVTELGLTVGAQFAPALSSMANGITDAVIGFRSLTNNQKSLLVDLPLLALGAIVATKAFTGMLGVGAQLTGTGDLFGIRSAIDNVRTLYGELKRVDDYTHSITGAQLSRRPGSTGNFGFFDPATNRPVRAADVTTTRVNAATGVAGTAMGMAGAVAGVIGTVFTVATIAVMAAQILPVIMDYIKNRNVPDADIDVKNYAQESKRIISSIALGGATPVEQYKQLNDQLKVVKQSFDDLNAGIKVNEGSLETAQKALRDYLAATADKQGHNMTADEIRKGSDLSGTQPMTTMGIEDTDANVDPTQAFIASQADDKKVVELRKAVPQAQSNIKNRLDSIKTIKEAEDNYNKALADIQARPGVATALALDKAKADKVAADIAEAAGFTYQSHAIATAVNKEARAAQLELEKGLAELNTDPFEVQRANIAIVNDKMIKTWEDWADKESKKIDTQFGTLLVGGDFGKALTGQSYIASEIVKIYNDNTGKSETIFKPVLNADGSKKQIQGAIDVLKGGGSDDAVKAALVSALNERLASISKSGESAPKEVLDGINKIKDANSSMIVAWLSKASAVDIVKLKEATPDKQRVNRDLVQTLRDAMFSDQTKMLEQIFSAGGSQDFSIKLKIDTTAINKVYEDALKQLDDEEKKFVDNLEGKYKSDPTLKAQWEQYVNTRTKIITETRNNALHDLAAANANSQTAALNIIKNATDQARIGESAISSQIEALIVGAGGTPSQGLSDVRRLDEQRTQIAKVDADLRAFQEERANLLAHRDALTGSIGKAPTPTFTIAPGASLIGQDGADKLSGQQSDDITVKMNDELARLKNYQKMQAEGIDAFKAIETTQAIIAGYKKQLGQGPANDNGTASTASGTPPKALEPTADPAATKLAIDQTNLEISAIEAKTSALQKYKDLLGSTYETQNSAANKANSDYKQDQANINENIRLYERTGTVTQGLNSGIAKMAISSKTDFQIASDAYTAFANSTATQLTDLLTGQQKNWRAALANIAKSIADTILKALMLRGLSSLFGGVGAIGTGGLPGTAGSSMFGPVAPSANGNIFGFANGGAFTNQIFNSPTMFKFANGGGMNLGVMAEAGPEAVVPLSRGPNGKLGISINDGAMPIGTYGGGSQASGGNLIFSPQSNFNVGANGNAAQPQSTSSKTQRDRLVAMQRDMQREHEDGVGRVIRKYQRPGGALYQGQ
jgi:TP901 family phage tail tape measure protein/lambda family phage tail tape measure protein